MTPRWAVRRCSTATSMLPTSTIFLVVLFTAVSNNVPSSPIDHNDEYASPNKTANIPPKANINFLPIVI